ncbi:MAG TPA: hypothetical protein VEU29_06890 [Actinomycetota bacterium]|nr:hypothetical protein [Actinomycetota bacterium]
MVAKRIMWFGGLCLVLLASWILHAVGQIMGGFPIDFCASSSIAPRPEGAMFVSQESSRLPAEVRCTYELGGRRVVRTATPKSDSYLAAYGLAAALPVIYVGVSLLRLGRRRRSTSDRRRDLEGSGPPGTN